jgi:excisionase family DNA binding protein
MVEQCNEERVCNWKSKRCALENYIVTFFMKGFFMKMFLNDDVANVEALNDVRYLTYPEVAKILRCSERTVHNRVRSGDIVPLRNGRLVLFTDQCIEEFLQRNKQTLN